MTVRQRLGMFGVLGKKGYVILLFVWLLLVPGIALAETGVTDGFKWDDKGGGNIIITGYTGAGGAIAIPAAINGKPVTGINSFAFNGNKGLTGVIIPDSVTSIDSFAFADCTGLTTITIPKNTKTLNSFAFKGCTGLTTITVANGVNAIGASWFTDYPWLQKVIIPESVTKIDAFAFNGCSSLTGVTLPNGVTSIGAFAFKNCSSLSTLSIPKGVKTIGEWAFDGCNKLTLSGEADSFAQQYAAKRNIPFTAAAGPTSAPPASPSLSTPGTAAPAPAAPAKPAPAENKDAAPTKPAPTGSQGATSAKPAPTGGQGTTPAKAANNPSQQETSPVFKLYLFLLALFLTGVGVVAILIDRRMTKKEGQPSPTSPPSPREAGKGWLDKALKDFYNAESSKLLENFLLGQPREKLAQVLGAIDLKGMATVYNPWGTGSFHRTKVLEAARQLARQERWEDVEACHAKLLEMTAWTNQEITPSDFLLLMDLGKDMMNLARNAGKPGVGPDYFQKKTKQALQVFQRICDHAAKGSDGYVEALQWQAACYVNLKETRLAKEAFQQVLQYDSGNKMAQEILPKLPEEEPSKGVEASNQERLEDSAGTNDNAVKHLIRTLENPSAGDDQRLAAARKLGGLGEQAIPFLLESLKKWQSNSRKFACEAFVVMGTVGIQPLIDYIIQNSRSKLDCDGPKCALIMIKEPVVEPLLAVLPTGDPQVVALAAYILGEIGDPRALNSMIPLLVHGDKEVRLNAIEALGKFCKLDLLQILLLHTADSDPEIRERVFWSLNHLVSRLVDTDADTLKRMLAVPLIRALSDPHPGVRKETLYVLSHLRDPQTLDAVRMCLQDREEEVQESAQMVLEIMGE